MTDIDVIMAARRAAQAQRVDASAEAVVMLHAAIAAAHPDYQTLTEQLATATQRIAELEGVAKEASKSEESRIRVLYSHYIESRFEELPVDDQRRVVNFSRALMRTEHVAGEAQPAPGTGAWAWQQMQRGPDVWVRRACWDKGEQIHLVDSKVWDTRGRCAVDPTHPSTQLTDWELCAAPGSTEGPRGGLRMPEAPSAKQAEFFALADSIAEKPDCPLTGQDGPTDEQMREWCHRIYGVSACYLSGTDVALMRCAWQAARVGMVPAAPLPSSDGLDWVQRYESLQTELAMAQAETISWQLRAERMKTRLAEEQESHKYTKGWLQRAEEQRDAWHSVASALDVRTEHGDEGEPRSNDDILGEVNEQVAGLLVDNDALQTELNQLKADCGPGLLFTIAGLRADLDKWSTWSGIHSQMAASAEASREYITGELRRLRELQERYETVCAERDKLRVELETTAGELAQLKSTPTHNNAWAYEELDAGRKVRRSSWPDGEHVERTGNLVRRVTERGSSDQVRCAMSDIHFAWPGAKNWEPFDSEARQSLQERYETVCTERDTAFAESAAARESGTASDEVTEEEALRIHDEAFPSSDYIEFARSHKDWRDAFRKALTAARRNHRPKESNARGPVAEQLVESQASGARVNIELKALRDRLQTIVDEQISPQPILPTEELVTLIEGHIARYRQFALPLSEAARTELAKVACDAWWGSNVVMTIDRKWLDIVDALAPRIARVGVRELSDAECDALLKSTSKRMFSELQAGPGHVFADARVVDPPKFACAVLAAAQGGEMRIGVDLATGPDETAYATRVDGKWRNATPEEIAAAGGFTLPRPPRGRKLTPEEKGRLMTLVEAYAIERNNADGVFQDESARWREFTSYVESLLAPQDEVRVELGEIIAGSDGWFRTPAGTALFSVSTIDTKVTQALSATPGDKYSFAIVARRVE